MISGHGKDNKIVSLRGLTGLVVLCLCFAIASCTQERQPCLTPKTASLNLVCVHYPADSIPSATSMKDTALPKALFGALTANGAQYVYYKNISSNFTLSLSPDADSCSWVVSPDSLAHPLDTLNFYYQRKLQFLSNACGYTYFYSLSAVHTTHNNIDSVLITNPSVTNDANTKQLKIFIHPN